MRLVHSSCCAEALPREGPPCGVCCRFSIVNTSPEYGRSADLRNSVPFDDVVGDVEVSSGSSWVLCIVRVGEGQK